MNARPVLFNALVQTEENLKPAIEVTEDVFLNFPPLRIERLVQLENDLVQQLDKRHRHGVRPLENSMPGPPPDHTRNQFSDGGKRRPRRLVFPEPIEADRGDFTETIRAYDFILPVTHAVTDCTAVHPSRRNDRALRTIEENGRRPVESFSYRHPNNWLFS